MGGMKRIMEEQEAEYQRGLAMCIEAGAIEECENHPGSYYDSGEGVEGALEQAENDEDREAIQAAYDDNSGIDYCPSCEKNSRD
jgi:hypothetical protein